MRSPRRGLNVTGRYIEVQQIEQLNTGQSKHLVAYGTTHFMADLLRQKSYDSHDRMLTFAIMFCNQNGRGARRVARAPRAERARAHAAPPLANLTPRRARATQWTRPTSRRSRQTAGRR